MNNNFNRSLETKKSLDKVLPVINKINSVFDKVDEKNLIKPKFREYTNKKFVKTDKAYVSILIIDEVYLPGILTLGYSLRKYYNKYNLICLVQDRPTYKMIGGEKTYFKGVSEKAINDILEIYDVVYGIDLLQLEPPKSNKHFTQELKHYKNISIYVTKIQVLGILNYDNILYIDSSSIVHKNLDYLFKEYPENSFLYDIEYEKTNMGLRGGMFIINPNIKYYNKALFYFYNYSRVFKNYYFVRGIDEVLLYFAIYPKWSKPIKKWTACIETFIYKKCPLYYYQTHKPFRKSPNEKPNKITYKIWDKFKNELLMKYPNYKPYFAHIKDLRKFNY